MNSEKPIQYRVNYQWIKLPMERIANGAELPMELNYQWNCVKSMLDYRQIATSRILR